MRKDMGFTIVELMIVIAVLGVLAMFAAPKVFNFLPEYRLKRAARDLYSTFQAARLESISAGGAGGRYAIAFNPAGGTYQILSDPGPDAVWGTGDDATPNPGQDGVYGNADDIPEKPPVVLAGYDPFIGFGFGPAATNATQGGGALPADAVSYINNMVVFNNRGLVNNIGYVYIENNNNQPAAVRTTYAIGTPSLGGVARIFKWYNPSGNWAAH